MDTVNEESTSIVTLTFTDEDGSGVTPDSGTYQIDDALTGVEIKASTAISPSASTHDITITASENEIIDTTKRSEIHRLTVTFVYDTTKNGTGEYLFEVINLTEIT